MIYLLDKVDLIIESQLELYQQRKDSRRILDKLSIGERFMLMFGRGELKRDPLRVEWKQ